MTISLRPIDAANWQQAIKLKVKDEQQEWVASNVYSLAQSKFGFAQNPDLELVPLAIYAGEEMVGFLMYNTRASRERFFIMRLMIDAAHQGRGYGRAALALLLAEFMAHPQAGEVAISYEPDNEPAARLYASLGFAPIGMHEDEVLAWRALNPQPAPWASLWNN